jgi:hypothetical protein
MITVYVVMRNEDSAHFFIKNEVLSIAYKEPLSLTNESKILLGAVILCCQGAALANSLSGTISGK